MGKGNKQVKQNQPASGGYPASQVQTLSSDSKFLFKIGQTSWRRGSSMRQFLRDVLSGSEDEIITVESQSQNNTYDYSIFDVTFYHGPLQASVEKWVAAHPIVGHR